MNQGGSSFFRATLGFLVILGGPRPVAKVKASSGRPEIEFARNATRMTMAKRMATYMTMDREAVAHMEHGGTRNHTARDPVADSHDLEILNQVNEQYAETTLGGTSQFNVELVTPAGPNYVQITGSSLNESLDRLELQKVIGGDTSVLSPTLLNILNTQGIQPEFFAENLLHLF